MDYVDLLKKALVYPFKRKEIFAFALIITFVGGVFNYINVFSNQNGNFNDLLNNRIQESQNANPIIDDVLGISTENKSLTPKIAEILGISTEDGSTTKPSTNIDFPNFGSANNLEEILPLIVLACGVCGIGFIMYLFAALYFTSVGTAAIVKSVQADSAGIVTSFKASWTIARKYWVRIALVNLIVGIFMLFIILVPLIFIIPIASMGNDATGVFVVLLCCMLPILFIFLASISAYLAFTTVYIVLEDKGIFDSLAGTARVIKRNISKVILFLLLLLGVFIFFGSISSFFSFFREILLNGLEDLDHSFVAISVIVRLITNFLILLPLSAYLSAFSISFTTLFMMEVIKKGKGTEEGVAKVS